jgi:tetratricopeptide (TPR) repeat protein
MSRVIVRQVPGTDPAAFLLVGQDGTTTPVPVVVPSPRGYPVPGAGNRDLLEELGWYLEQFLDYPFAPATERADAVQAALRNWGKDAFDALFGSAPAVRLLDEATRQGYGMLDLDVSSDDPRVLGWPWEALYSPEKGWLVHHCAVGRRLNTTLPPPAIPEALPRDRLNILLVTARPYENDVAYRSIARPLVELVDRGGFPASVHVLRPPTLEALRKHLREHPGQYHVLHFDGHGAYGRAAAGVPSAADPNRFLSPAQGRVVFETEEGKPDPVPAETLSQLLAEHRIPAVVMNACQSGQVDEHAEDAFASVAASLLRAGVGGVVAMAYSLFVSGAEQFLPAFYGRLFDTGDLAEAVRAGRQQMLAQDKRTSPRGRFPLQDWLVPVLYEHQPVCFELERSGEATAGAEAPALPPEARERENPYGFVGRDRALLQLERAMRLPRAGILVHGLGGIGKTTLARGFLEWLARTGGLGHGAFWFQFDEISSAEYVLNRLGETLFGAAFATLSTPEKLEHLGRVLEEEGFVVVWDNFEVVQGIEAAGVEARLPVEDRGVLKELLKRLRGGRTKVLITSRSEEEWLGEVRRKLPLGGLVGEERWAFVEAVLRELGVEADRQDAALVELVDLLEGHPLGMRILLPKLEERTAGELVSALKENVAALGPEREVVEGRLWATLRFVEEGVPERLRGLLYRLGLHERFVDADYLQVMAQVGELSRQRQEVDELLGMLERAGLVQDVGQGIHQLHPVLTGFLRSRSGEWVQADEAERWSRGFVEVFVHLTNRLGPRPLHEKRGFVALHEANVLRAQQMSDDAGMHRHAGALLEFRARYAGDKRSWVVATRLYRELAQRAEQLRDEGWAAVAYHQLGVVAAERRSWEEAKGWYQKSLAIEEHLADESGTASTYHQLGIVAAEQRSWEEAEGWYQKSLAILKRLRDEPGTANTYHQLGMVAAERRSWEEAEGWYQKSLAIEERLGNEHGAALTYHQLGMVAAARRTWEEAEGWYQKSLAILNRLGDEHTAAITYHQLGIVAAERRSWEEAEGWYQKSLAIKERLGDEYGAAITYHQLGIVAAERQSWEEAEGWYQKSLATFKRLGDEYGAAIAYHQLGMVAVARRSWEEAEGWYQKSLAIKERLGDEHGVALTVAQMAVTARDEGRVLDAGRGFIQAVQRFARARDSHRTRAATEDFRRTLALAAPDEAQELERLWKEAGLPAFGEGL